MLSYVPFAIIAGVLGGIIAVSRIPRAIYRSMIQHLAAGLLTAIIAVNLLPEVRNEGDPILDQRSIIPNNDWHNLC